MPAACQIRPATPEEMETVRALFREYQAELKIDLCFQSFEEELASLPGRYAPPQGSIYLAEDESGEILGVVAMRALDPNTAEMKRLFVRPGNQGRGLGRALAEAVIDTARRRGYARLLLDTLPSMSTAIALYRKLGFVEIPPYTTNPVQGALFLQLNLGTDQTFTGFSKVSDGRANPAKPENPDEKTGLPAIA